MLIVGAILGNSTVAFVGDAPLALGVWILIIVLYMARKALAAAQTGTRVAFSPPTPKSRAFLIVQLQL